MMSFNDGNSIIDEAYSLIDKINEAIKAAEECEIYSSVLENAISIKVEACSQIDEDTMNSTYLPISDEDVPELKALLKVLVLKKGKEANSFLERTLGQKPEPKKEVVVSKNATATPGNRAMEVVKLHDEDGLTFEQIGSRLGISRSNAYNIYKKTTTGT